MLYRIKWTSKLNGTTGFGIGEYSFEEAKLYAKSNNEREPKICFHTVVLVGSDEGNNRRIK